MANTIQIKRGEYINNAPALFDGELAFDKSNNKLYIGKETEIEEGGEMTTIREKLQVAPSIEQHNAVLENFNSLAKYFSINGNPIIPIN